jgi:RNA polymerase sigma factor (sigma-70 family)
MEHDLKRDRELQDSNGKAVLDKNGNPIILPEREISLDKLIAEDWDFPDGEPLLENTFIRELEFKELHRCINLLNGDERDLIQALFFDELTIREYAEYTGKTKSSVDRKKKKILDKLKIFLNN